MIYRRTKTKADIEKSIQETIDQNNAKKDLDFATYIIEPYDKWKLEPK